MIINVGDPNIYYIITKTAILNYWKYKLKKLGKKMNKYFIIISICFYLNWIFILAYKIKHLNNKYENIDKILNNLIEKTYIEAVSFEKSKNFTKALQKNLKQQIDCFITLYQKKDVESNSLKTEVLNCLKDTVDISDMTFYVGNDVMNMLLRKKVRECYYKNIVLDVVADLRDVAINSSHLFLIFSDMIDWAIRYTDEAKERSQKAKILIRASRANSDNCHFFVMQIAYDIINNKEDININQYITEYHKNVLDLLIDYYNGTLISNIKSNRIIKTITIQIPNSNSDNLDIKQIGDFL